MSVELTETFPNRPLSFIGLFNSPEFFLLHRQKGDRYFSFRDHGDYVSAGHFSLVSPGIYRSPRRGTFGGLEFAPGTSAEHMQEIIGLTVNALEGPERFSLQVVHRPLSCDPATDSASIFAWQANGFRIAGTEINHALRVDGNELVERMERNNRKRLRKAERESLSFMQVHGSESIASVHSIIRLNRESKGYSISLSVEQLTEMADTFPDRIFFFTANWKGNPIAASVCIKISTEMLYIFYWGDLPGHSTLSPVVFLASGIYDFARQNGFSLLDAGTSSLNGVLKPGVCHFKEGLGFEASLKFTLARDL